MLIKKYTPEWAKKFASLKNVLDKALEGLECQVEHIGSTAVPGLDAKDIIDIDIIFYHNSDFDKIKTQLVRAGYYHNGDQGIKHREVFKRSGEGAHETLDMITHHLYVCPRHSNALERHLLTRDFLRKNEWARLQYQELKHDLADRANQDKKVYAELKELHASDLLDSFVQKEKQL